MNKKQRGFSIVELCILVVVIGSLAGASVWYTNRDQTAKNAQQGSAETSKPNLIKYSDSSNTFSFDYPDSWSLIPYAVPGTDGDEQTEQDWAKTPQPIKLNNRANQKAEITITGYTSIDTTIDKEIATSTQDQFNAYSKVTINGYAAAKHELDFVGPSSAEKYKDTTYILLHNNAKVEIKFREKYSNSTTSNQYDFDVTNLASDFQSIVDSIKFLN